MERRGSVWLYEGDKKCDGHFTGLRRLVLRIASGFHPFGRESPAPLAVLWALNRLNVEGCCMETR